MSSLPEAFDVPQLFLGGDGPDLAHGPSVPSSSELAEREHVGLGAGLEELDLERAVAHRLSRADELVQAAFLKQAVAVLVDVQPV